jgi:hypothetical protein
MELKAFLAEGAVQQLAVPYAISGGVVEVFIHCASADALSLPPRSIKSRITGALSLHDYHKFLSKSADRGGGLEAMDDTDTG